MLGPGRKELEDMRGVVGTLNSCSLPKPCCATQVLGDGTVAGKCGKGTARVTRRYLVVTRFRPIELLLGCSRSGLCATRLVDTDTRTLGKMFKDALGHGAWPLTSACVTEAVAVGGQ